MLRHVQCTYPNLSWLLVVAAACLLAACGGSIGGDSVTGSSVVAAPSDLDLDLNLESAVDQVQWGDLFENEDGTITSSGNRQDKVLVCHKGRKTLWVSRQALRGHTRHGDVRGRCDSTPSAKCPCFSKRDIESAASSCTSHVAAQCGMGDPYFLLLSCDAGGNVPPGILGIYLSQTADGGYCARQEGNDFMDQSSLTGVQHQACVNTMIASGYCPAS